MACVSSNSFHSLSSTSSSSSRATFISQAPPCYVSFRNPHLSISAFHATADRAIATIDHPINTSSFYEVLGIQDGATCKEIKAAYRKLARIVHPDAVTSNGQMDATSAADDFIRVHEAYATLSDPRKRADYDRMLFFKRRRIAYSPDYAVLTANYETASYSGFSGHTRRSWETDQCW